MGDAKEQTEYKPRHVYQVCGGDQLYQLTAQGWRLVHIITERGVMMVSDTVPIVANGYQQSATAQRNIECTHIKYLLEMDEASVLKKFNEEWNEQATKLAAATKRAGEMQELYAKQCTVTNQMEMERNVAKAKITATEELQTRARKMETDLGKIRLAIGDLRMREIVEDVKL